MASGMMNKVVVATLDEQDRDAKNLSLLATPAEHTGGSHVH